MKNSQPTFQTSNVQIFLEDTYVVIMDYYENNKYIKLNNVDLGDFIQTLKESGDVDFPLFTTYGDLIIYNKNKEDVINRLSEHSELLELIS